MALDFSKWLGAIKVFFGGKKKDLVLIATREALAKSRRTKTRVRNEKGHFVSDDKSTPNINEAYEGYVNPKKLKSKTSKKKTSTRKTSRSRGRKK